MTNEEITMSTVTRAVVNTSITARQYVDENDFDESAEIANDFLSVLSEYGLVNIDEDMSDLDKIEAGMYAANLYLAACAKIGRTETQRLSDAQTLERSLRIS
jgi:hypothetical protein